MEAIIRNWQLKESRPGLEIVKLKPPIFGDRGAWERIRQVHLSGTGRQVVGQPCLMGTIMPYPSRLVRAMSWMAMAGGLVINFAPFDAIIGEAEKESTETARQTC